MWHFGIVAGAVVLTGCNQEQTASSQARTSVAEVRGSRIESKPVLSNETAKAETDLKNASSKELSTPPAASVAAIVSNPPPPQPASPAREAGDPPTVGFDKLASFTYDMPDESLGKPETVRTNAPTQIPKTVLALDKQRVALSGFMLPLKVEGGLVTELLLMKDQSMCCYGAVPKITEWVSVKMTTKGIKPVMDQPVTLHGQLKVGEIRENGFLVGIYAMDGEKMIGPLDL